MQTIAADAVQAISEKAAQLPEYKCKQLNLRDRKVVHLSMADSKTKPTGTSVAAFVDALPQQARRTDAKALIKLMSKASGEKAEMWGPSIIGFGTYHYKYESGREGDTLLVGFSPRKAALVLYGVTGIEEAASLLSKLGPHTTGKGCLYIRKLSDIDQNTLDQLIARSVAAKRMRTA